jgi:FAD/FMN-containing dehydrogenase
MNPRAAQLSLAGWGNYPVVESPTYRPGRLSGLLALMDEAGPKPQIARGLGRSYGDPALACKDGAVVLCTRLDRMLNFDADQKVLHCEAGVSLEQILDVFVPRGYFLPVTPGTKFVTVGGAIAADVHGKNHHVDGTFGRFVRSLRLLTADGRIVDCSSDHNADLFNATVGGMGLTGHIVSAELELRPIQSAYVHVTYQKATDLDAALAAFADGDERYLYSVAWIDCLASGRSLGRSVLMRGNPADAAEATGAGMSDPLVIAQRRKKTVPINLPSFILNPLSVRAFNAMFYRMHGDQEKLVDYDSYFYPLDAINHWNRGYGRRGFVQYQPLLPPESSRAGLIEILERLSASGQASFLAVLKSTGAQGDGLLSFPMPGHTLALDIPNTGPKLTNLLNDLDRIVLKHGGRLYLAKDATMSPATFARMYGSRLEQFQQVRRQTDPTGRFGSHQSQRLGLDGEGE